MNPHVTSAEMHSIRKLLKEGDGKHLFWQTLIAATSRCQFCLLVGSNMMDSMDGSCLNYKERSKIKLKQSELFPCVLSTFVLHQQL